ncbi:MAG: class I SAM-dependent methyltransferase [Acidimicrobiales bacterium]
MPEPSRWVEITTRDPNHSRWYIERFRSMAAAGDDLAGEARFVDALAPRGARILDAGCGPGRVGAELARRGHTVVGVDVDPELIAAAREDHPGPTWLVGDLAELDLAARGEPTPFDAVVCAGNVMPFLAESTRWEVLARLGAHLADEGRIAVGFGAGRGYDFADYRADADAAGLRIDLELASWDLRPLRPDSDFLVTVLSRRAGASGG